MSLEVVSDKFLKERILYEIKSLSLYNREIITSEHFIINLYPTYNYEANTLTC